jgi:hypothetical protein
LLSSGTAIAAASVWSTPPLALTTTTNIEPVSSPKTIINAKGQVLTTWIQGTQLQAKIRNANKWSAAVAISPLGESSQLLDSAESPLNEAVVLYTSAPVAPGVAITETSFFSNGKWATPSAIPATIGAKILNARVAYDGQTTLPATPTATLVWVEQVNNPTPLCNIMAAKGNAASGFGAPINIGTGCFSFIQLAVNKRGEAALALGAAGGRRGSPAVVTSRNTSGVWTTLTDLGSMTYGTPPVVAIPDNGAAIAVFSDAMLGVQWSRRSPVDGSWSAKATIDGSVPAVPTGIAMAANGKAMVVYNSYYTNVGPAPLQVASLLPGSNAWKMDLINPYITDMAGTIDNFQITATPAGSFLVGWVEAMPTIPAGATSSMGVSVLPAGTTAWSITTLGGDLSGLFTAPSAFTTSVAASTGRAITVWNNYDVNNMNLSVLNSVTAAVK